MQLNKYLAYAGISSRRKSAELIKQGLVSINNWVVTEPGYVVKSTDAVRVNKKLIVPEQNVYVLLNKPKGYITTTDDEKNRPTVLDLLVDSKITQNLKPVGRLDRDTTGLLLLTNDGNLAQRLSHPRYEISKTYIVTLNRPFDFRDSDALKNGVTLPDGEAFVDGIQTLNQSKTRLKVLLHSGKNRIIRRLFDHFGYTVTKLDRTGYDDLSKKNLPVGRWRFLTPKEINQLKSCSSE